MTVDPVLDSKQFIFTVDISGFKAILWCEIGARMDYQPEDIKSALLSHGSGNRILSV